LSYRPGKAVAAVAQGRARRKQKKGPGPAAMQTRPRPKMVIRIHAGGSGGKSSAACGSIAGLKGGRTTGNLAFGVSGGTLRTLCRHERP